MNEQIKKFYSNKSLAQLYATRFAEQEKQTIYLYESRIDDDQFEYSLRTLDEIVSMDCDNVLREYKYRSTGTIEMRVLDHKPKRKYKKRTASVVDSNLPTGLGHDPGDEVEWKTCPTCDGDSIKDEHEHCFTCESKGAIPQSMFADLKAEEANEYQ